MFKNYCRHGWRNLLKNKLSTLINIGGLSIGLATGIIILLWINGEVSYDAFHQHKAGIYQLMSNSYHDGRWFTGDATPAPLAEKMKLGFPEIKYTTRQAYGGQQLLSTGKKSIYQQSMYADPDYFNIFTFPAISGNPVTALQDPGAIILTESTAHRLFGDKDPIGSIIKHNNQHHLRVAAVIRDAPENSSIQFDVVLPFRLYELENADWINRWDNYRVGNIALLQPGSSVEGFNKKLKDSRIANATDSINYLFAYPFTALHLHSGFKNGKPSGGRIEIMLLLGTIGLFILLIACINFMNLSTARAERRAREVGVRKVLGASRITIILQFLIEALIITFGALLLGILLAKLALPGLNRISGKSISLDFMNWQIWTGLLLLLLFTGLVAGSYPAFFLSGFRPVKVLKGVISTNRGGGLFRKSLVTFQFIISIFLIITTIVIYKQLQYGESRPVGYNQDNLLEIPARGEMANKYLLLQEDLLRIPEIESVSAGTDDLLRFGGATDGIAWPGKTADQNFSINITWVKYDWVKTAGLQLAAGRDFSPEYGRDSAGCLVNEAAVKKMGLKEPVIGTMLGNNPIIGVVKDFVVNNPYRSSPPLVIYFGSGPMSHIFVRLRKTEHPETALAKIEAAIKKSNPEFPFEFSFTKEAYRKMFTGLRSSGFMLNWTSSLAILISCLGLFGLSTYLAERRSKEIGIRKIMGASVGRIWYMLAKEFLKPVFIAFVITVPLALLAMQEALRNVDYRVSLQWWMFAAAGILTALIALLTISFQGTKAAMANPVKALQSE
ncbi:ABC transporter permease [Chitinophaga ginsengisegetis]|uniref:ABC transporter permease n=1 Tax=Chitinophaga ginsengisegetis TaxID=393003 RepID=UPI000DBA3DFB|nr:ABC transporter permease [Chitinophaga ginsengisegetis]MDR6570859.1 ABC-type antimicrobial peptide transport system permease subunit [Chitinophaga ginsengisegetis]MDR6650593.1 ABC-type antimicrobial peptide transport system permease subunit [Chitinophaga ginsengisegetis]MDR6656768.1 ABC-type antimicrobial peptide transport system permease subunit [Chitinophaga ginsengisegetis]